MTSSWDLNVEGYRLIADVLVTFRRIVARAVVKAHAEADPRTVWPPEVLETLERRWREEVETERQPSAEDDVLSYATFADLAALAAGGGEVSALLARLSPSSGELLELLHELELLRHRIAIANPLTEVDLERLLELQGEFRAMLAGGRGGDRGRAAAADGGAARGARTKRSGEGATSRGKAKFRVGRRVEDRSPETSRAKEEEGLPKAKAGRASAPSQPPAAVPAPATSPHPGPTPPAAVSIESLEAIASGDDRQILGELHREVMALAEGIYSGGAALGAPVWRELVDRQWVDARRDDLALDPLLRFHSLIEVLADIDLTVEQRRATLNEAGFAPLLLELRQMFRRHLA